MWLLLLQWRLLWWWLLRWRLLRHLMRRGRLRLLLVLVLLVLVLQVRWRPRLLSQRRRGYADGGRCLAWVVCAWARRLGEGHKRG